MRVSVLLCAVLALCAGAAGAADVTATNRTVITSDRLEFDYARSAAIFEGNVVVTDPAVRIESDKLNVLFSRTNTLESVTAVGNVVMNYGDKNARCDKAIYLSGKGELLLIGRVELRRGQDTVNADVIRYWLADDRMVCEPGRMVVFQQEGAHGGGEALLGLPRGTGGKP